MENKLTKKQYKSLLRALDVAGFIYGIMGDTVDKKYKKQSKENDDLIDEILKYADQFGQTAFVEKFEGKNVLSDDYSNKILEDIAEFEEYVFWDNLVSKLSLKGMHEKYSPEEIEKMEEMDFLKGIWELEEKYHEILEKDGIDNFELKK